ncbi:MAG: Ycf66 family protein, partial [Microcoleaceae cyanobacterium]
MLAYLLAILVGIGSLTLYMSAFFFPEVHRRGDFIWSGIGLFYALILWLCAGRITGAVLLGETAGVSLLLWFGWQTLLLRRDLTPVLEKTPVNSTEIAEKTSKFSGIFPKSAKQKKNVTKVKDSPADQVATVAETVQENMAEIATAVSDQIPTIAEVSDSLSGLAEQAIHTAENLGNQLSNTAGAIASNIATNTEEITQVTEEKLTSVGEVVGEKIEEVLPTENPADKLVENIKTTVDEWGEPIAATEKLVANIDKTVDEWGEVIGEKADSLTTSVTEKTQGAIANIQEAVKPEKKSAGFASVLKPVTGFFNNFRKGNKSPVTIKTDEKLVVNNISETVNDVSKQVTDVITDKTE